MDRMKLLLLMDKLEQLVRTSPVVPMTGRVVVPLEAMEDALRKLREAIPEELGVSPSRHAVSARAPDRAGRGGGNSAERGDVAGRPLGPAILVEAERRAEHVRRGADRYADDVLRRLERSLDDALKVVRRGRDELKAPATAGADERVSPDAPVGGAAEESDAGGAQKQAAMGATDGSMTARHAGV